MNVRNLKIQKISHSIQDIELNQNLMLHAKLCAIKLIKAGHTICVVDSIIDAILQEPFSGATVNTHVPEFCEDHIENYGKLKHSIHIIIRSDLYTQSLETTSAELERKVYYKVKRFKQKAA